MWAKISLWSHYWVMRYLMQNNAKLFPKAALLICTPLAVYRRRQWQPTPVFLPGESQGWGSLVGCCLWGRTELDTTEATYQQQQCIRQPVDLLISDIWNWCLDFAPFILLSLGFFVCLFPFFSSIELMKNSFFPFSSLTSLGVVRFFCSFSDYFTIFNMYT